VRASLASAPDLLKPDWRRRNADGHPMTGHCYVAAEALWHLLGGPAAGWTPRVLGFADDRSWRAVEPGEQGLTHWWLEHEDGRRLDPTGDQFATPVPYERGRYQAFLTNAKLAGRPSIRTRKLLVRLGFNENGLAAAA
jgi:hypothetical protein